MPRHERSEAAKVQAVMPLIPQCEPSEGETMPTYVDVFPVIPEALPKLYAYAIEVVSDHASAIGGKLAYRLRNKFGGNWIWCGGQIVTDQIVPDDAIKEFLKQLWTEQPLSKEFLKQLWTEQPLSVVQSITLNTTWEPSAWEQGEFAARGLLANYQTEIREVLEPKGQNFGKVRIHRDYALRGWAVNNKPAVSIAVSSNIFHTQLLHEFAATLQSPQDLIGIMVAVDRKDFKGTIIEITGNVREMREWLLSISSDEMTRNLISRAPDDELTVKIETRTSQYIYIASMLRPVVRMGDLKKFGVDPRQVSRALRLGLSIRYSLVREIAAIGKKHRILADSFESGSLPQAFLSSSDVGFTPKLRVGNNQIHRGEGQSIYQSLKEHGVFQRSSAFPDKDHPIKIGIVNASSQVAQQALTTFLYKLKDALEELNFSIQSVEVNGQRQQRIETLSRVNLENAVNCLESAKPDILLALFPRSARYGEGDEEDSMYHVFKSLTMRYGLPSQVIYEDTFSEQYAMDNIVLGI
ncbi:MAG: hypothetical protein Q6K95_09415, partial [Gloeomargarita sp. GXS_bins_116]